MKDFMYIISNEEGYIKVGISKNPTKRLKQLQTGNHHKLSLLFTEEFNCTRPHLLHIETKIHNELGMRCKRQHGEWFEVDEKELKSIQNLITYHRIRFEEDTAYFIIH